MSLDENDTISKLQSSTVKAALTAIIINVLSIIAILGGKTYDIEAIKHALDTWLPLGINTASILLGYFAYKGRVNATKQIK